MTLIAANPASANSFTLLVDAAIRSLALAGIAGIGLAAFRVKATTVRLFTWTGVLYAALAMPMLEWMLPAVPVPTPAMLQHGTVMPNSSAIESVRLVHRNVTPPASSTTTAYSMVSPRVKRTVTPPNETQPVVAIRAESRSLLSFIPWGTVAAAIYVAVALLLFARFGVGLVFGYRLLRRSLEIDDARVTLRLGSRANAVGLAFTPRIAESEFISVPLTMGVLNAVILLPAGWREWDDAKLDAVVAHEVSHVARRDALTQRISLLHRAIFWFSPLAWWLDRRLADLAEEASDEAALISGADRKDYAQTLLGFFEALQMAPGRVWWQGVSMAKAGQAEERLERILSWKGSVAMRLKKSIAVAVLTLAVPVIYLSASVRAAGAQSQAPTPAQQPVPVPEAQSDITPPPAADAPAPPETSSQAEPTPAPTEAPSGPGPVAGDAPTSGAPIHAPVAPMAPRAPIPPIRRRGHYSASGSSYSQHGFSYGYGYDDEQRFVIVTGKTDSLTMSGNSEDARHVEKLRKQIPGDFIWFQRDEKSYIIRDQATIDRARKLWAPQEELGKKQEELGKQQEALGKQQEELSARMEQIHVNVPDMTAELDKLKAELKQLNSNATMEQVGHVQSEIGELQSKIGELQSQAGDQQGKLGELMGALGEKQGKLGAQQGELGRQQAKLAQEASRQMKQLLDDAIAKGLAQLEL